MEKQMSRFHWDLGRFRKDPEKQFFLLTGFWFFLVTLGGFADSFYFKTSVTPNPGFLIVHGVVFSSWVLIYLIQCLLISSRNVVWHMRLGKFGVMILLLVLITGFYTILHSAEVRSNAVKEETLMQIFLGVSIAFIAIYQRKKPYIHKRLMVLAMVFLTVAAVQRLARTFWNYDGNFWLITILYLVPLVAMVVFDLIYFKKIKLLSLLILTAWLVQDLLMQDVYKYLFNTDMGKNLIEVLKKAFLWI